MKTNYRALNPLLQEMNGLSEVIKQTPQQKRRYAFLQTAIPAIRSGASVDDLEQEYTNDIEQHAGLPLTPKKLFVTREQRTQFDGWKSFISRERTAAEKRDMLEGDPLARIGSYSGLGFFVPTEYFPQLFSALGAHDVLFDDDSVTMIKTTNGRPLPIPVLGDIEEVAAIVGENNSQSSVDFQSTGSATVGVYTYNSKRFVISMEAFQDASDALTIIDISKQVFASRLSRGIGADLLVGDGSGKPLGLLHALSNLGVTPVVATGSAANTGGVETGVNSIGSADFANVLAAIDSAYLDSDKACWLMNKKTLGYVNGIVTKQGSTLDLVKYVDGQPYILGLPVKISPSMPNIGASATPVLLGDLRYWATRLVVDENAGLMVYREGAGLVEKGNVGIGAFVRAGGALLYTDTSSPAPFVVLQNHS